MFNLATAVGETNKQQIATKPSKYCNGSHRSCPYSRGGDYTKLWMPGAGAPREPSENAASHRLYVTEQPEGHWLVIVSTQAAMIKSTDRGLNSRDLLLTDLEF